MRTARILSVVSPLSIGLLTALGSLTGPPSGIPDASFADAVAGLMFLVNLVPGLVAASFARVVTFSDTTAQFMAVGVVWAVLSALQWHLVARFVGARRRLACPS